MRRSMVAAAALVAAAACGTNQTEEESQVQGFAQPETVPMAKVSSPLVTDVTFARQGGLAGFDDRLAITRDGNVTGTVNGGAVTGSLTAEQVSELAALLERSGAFNETRSYPAEGADLITYTVTYSGTTVTAQDGGIPEPLDPVLAFLSDLLAQVTPTG